MKRFKRYSISLLLAVLLFSAKSEAQLYRLEAGLSAGGSYYKGDANQTALFKSVNPAFGLMGKYHFNGRFSIRAQAGYAGISGSTVGQEEAFPHAQAVSFHRELVEASAQMEMNFYEFGTPDFVPGSSRISPYVCAGIGVTGYQTGSLKTAGFIPFGLGIKVKLLDRYNLGCEWSVHQTFSDDLDYSKQGGSFQLKDPWLVRSAWNKNKDSYSVLMVYFSVDIVPVMGKCFR